MLTVELKTITYEFKDEDVESTYWDMREDTFVVTGVNGSTDTFTREQIVCVCDEPGVEETCGRTD